MKLPIMAVEKEKGGYALVDADGKVIDAGDINPNNIDLVAPVNNFGAAVAALRKLASVSCAVTKKERAERAEAMKEAKQFLDYIGSYA